MKKKLAFVSPFPPLKTGISDYSFSLLPFLSVYYEVEIIYSIENKVDFYTKYDYRDVSYFKNNYYKYERVLYHFGNSQFHIHMINLLNQFPGVIVIHDFFLSDLINHFQSIDKEKLYIFHGYETLIKNNNYSEYPCNKDILNKSLGIVVHSDYALNLFRKWYYDSYYYNISKIPLLKDLKTFKYIDKKELGLKADSFVIASFGLITHNKQVLEILESWTESLLSKVENCYLVFVGELEDSIYMKNFLKKINTLSCSSRVIITGWVDELTYHSYLKVSNIAVQLRNNSKGETSASLLDTLQYGISTIVNNNGSNGEIPSDVVHMLNDNFNNKDLKDALELIFNDSVYKKRLISKSKQYISKTHNPKVCTELYFKAIEKSYSNITSFEDKYIDNLLETKPDNEIIKALPYASIKKFKQRQILVDVSSIIKKDLNTGIQRVVKLQIIELIRNSPKNFRIEPIYLKKVDDLYIYVYAREYTSKLLNETLELKDEPIFVNKDDIFYGLDLVYEDINIAIKENIFKNLKVLGVKFVFLVYDILPITHKSFFPKESYFIHKKWLENILSISDLLITISDFVKKEIESWILENSLKESNKLEIIYQHLGADFKKENNIKELRENNKNKNINFLVVGTIEPRKGHELLLKSFDLLWKENYTLILHIVGKKGWLVEELYTRIKKHPFINKKVYLYESISDDKLKKLYIKSDCVIIPSIAEGFGLPIIEAALYHKPIIARDIEVFREVALEGAYYFPNMNNPELLHSSIKDWIDLYYKNIHPSSSSIPILTWKQNALKTLEVLRKL